MQRHQTVALRERGLSSARFYCSPSRPPAGRLARARPAHAAEVAAVGLGTRRGALDAAGGGGPRGAGATAGADHEGGRHGAGLLPAHEHVPGPGGEPAGPRAAARHSTRRSWRPTGGWRSSPSTRPTTPSARGARRARGGATWSTSAGCASRRRAGTGVAAVAASAPGRLPRARRRPRAARWLPSRRRVATSTCGRAWCSRASSCSRWLAPCSPTAIPPSRARTREKRQCWRRPGRCSRGSAGRPSSSPTAASAARNCSSR